MGSEKSFSTKCAKWRKFDILFSASKYFFLFKETNTVS